MASSEDTRPLFWPPHAESGSSRICKPPDSTSTDGRPAGDPRLDPNLPLGPSVRRSSSILQHPALQGYHLHQLLESSPVAEYWQVTTPAGDARTLHRYFGLTPQRAAQGLAQLQTIDHPGLILLDYLCGFADQVILLGEPFDYTLREFFTRYWDRGFPGVPAPELLDCLRPIADTLDVLYESHGLHHLALNPRRVVFRRGRFLLSEFGLMQSLWLPDRWLSPQLNTRYAAPEVFLGRFTPKTDQFSLALMYAEMRTGVHPLARRWPADGAEPDLALLSSPEREVLGRALSPQAYARFPGCSEMIRALAAALGTPEPAADDDPEIESVRPTTNWQIIPVDAAALQALQAATLGGWQLRQLGAIQVVTEPGAWLDHTFLVSLSYDQMIAQLGQLLSSWGADHFALDGRAMSFCLAATKSWWAVPRRRRETIQVRLGVRPIRQTGREAALAVHVRLRPDSSTPASAAALDEVGLSFVQALRDRLKAIPDLRRQQRWECRRPLRIVPVGDNLQVLPSVDCTGKDVSTHGIGFLAPGWFPSSQLAIHLPWLAGFANKALRATVVRCTPRPDGSYEVGATFQ